MRSSRALVLGTLMILAALPAQAQRRAKTKPKAKPAPVAKVPAVSAAEVQAYKDQIATLAEEVASLKTRLASSEENPQTLAAVQRSRDLAREEAQAAKRELADLKASLGENQKSGEAILEEARAARKAQAEAQAEASELKRRLGELEARVTAGAQEGALVVIGPDVVPAVPLNLNRVTPKVKKVDPGCVVVNVLINAKGEVEDARLLQGLPGDNEWVRKAHEACVEAARRLVFDPARSRDGKTRFKVWQGVGFHID